MQHADPDGRYRDAVGAEVAALEQDIRAHVVDLEDAFGNRDWATVARIYRAVAELADRLELLDPGSRARQQDRAEAASAGLLARAPVELDAAADEVDALSAEDAGARFSFEEERPRWLR